jgi:hypothetical protein
MVNRNYDASGSHMGPIRGLRVGRWRLLCCAPWGPYIEGSHMGPYGHVGPLEAGGYGPKEPPYEITKSTVQYLEYLESLESLESLLNHCKHSEPLAGCWPHMGLYTHNPSQLGPTMGAHGTEHIERIIESHATLTIENIKRIRMSRKGCFHTI